MNQSELEAFVAVLENVQREENWGTIFFFVGDDHRIPFVSITDADNEYDSVSNLNREGVFRVNIGLSKETFKLLVGESEADNVDYSVLNIFMAHPHYAKQRFVCILNPSGENAERTKQLILEAHTIVASRKQGEH